jgi:hypothetical protein
LISAFIFHHHTLAADDEVDEAQTAERPDFRVKRDMIAQHDKGIKRTIKQFPINK